LAKMVAVLPLRPHVGVNYLARRALIPKALPADSLGIPKARIF
jgi:hypothetical protein